MNLVMEKFCGFLWDMRELAKEFGVSQHPLLAFCLGFMKRF